MKTRLDEENVKALFASCSKEFDVLLGIFELTVPDWDRVQYVLEGKPSIGEEGWHAIYELFQKFNEEHPGESVFPGGLWLSMGFSIDKNLEAWEVDTSAMKFLYKSESSDISGGRVDGKYEHA
ncbi:MAG: hypothetical protein QUS07_08310 [Methanothrix sp.]|nr:hypothetical protein [Methanothrix sp.]